MKVSKEYKIGLLVLVGTVMVFIALNFLKSGHLFGRSNEYYAVFDDANGLNVGNEVQLNGVKIGEVLEVELHPLNPNFILAKFNIENEDIKIPKSSEAWLISVDVLSTMCIDLRLDLSDSASTELLTDGDTLKSIMATTLDQQLKSQLEPIKKKAEVLIQRVQGIIVDVNQLWDSSASYTFEESVYEARHAIETYRQLANNLINLINGETQMVAGIKNNFNIIKDSLLLKMNSINSVSTKITEIKSHLSGPEIILAVANINVSMTEMDALILKINSGEGSLGALTKKPDFQNSLKETQTSLELLMNSITADPMNYVGMSILGKKIQGLKLTKDEEEKLKIWLSE